VFGPGWQFYLCQYAYSCVFWYTGSLLCRLSSNCGAVTSILGLPIESVPPPPPAPPMPGMEAGASFAPPPPPPPMPGETGHDSSESPAALPYLCLNVLINETIRYGGGATTTATTHARHECTTTATTYARYGCTATTAPSSRYGWTTTPSSTGNGCSTSTGYVTRSWSQAQEEVSSRRQNKAFELGQDSSAQS
jgi:hypothetical protein